MTFPRHMSTGMAPVLPALKAPMAAPQAPAEPSMPAMPAIKAPAKVKGATVTVKKPKPSSSNLRIKNGM